MKFVLYCLKLNLFIILATIGIFIGFTLEVSAQTDEAPQAKYTAGIKSSVFVEEDLSAEVSQTINITNRSNELFTSSIEFTFPYERISNLKVVIDGRKSSGIIESDRIIIDFGKDPLEENQSKKISISYRADNFAENYDQLYRIRWPQFLNREQPVENEVTITYPADWGEIIYYSKRPEKTIEVEDYLAVTFKSSNQFEIVSGKYTFKEAKLAVNAERAKSNPRSLSFNLFKGSYLNGGEGVLQQINTPENNSGLAKLYFLDLDKYAGNRNLKLMIDEGNIDYPVSTSPSLYDSGLSILTTEEESASTPGEIFKLVKERLTPNYHIHDWKRMTIQEILAEEMHSDLDYASVSTALLKRNGYASVTVLGLMEYPFSGDYYWHFWTVYLDEEGNYIHFDPFVADAFGTETRDNITPFRFEWQTVSTDSDLSEILPDIFHFEVRQSDFAYLESITAKTGYLISQTARPLPQIEREVLGLSIGPDNNILNKRLPVNLILFAFGGITIVLILTLYGNYQYGHSLIGKDRLTPPHQ